MSGKFPGGITAAGQSTRVKADRSGGGVRLVFELADLVLDLQFLALEFGDLGVTGGWVGYGIRQLDLKGLVLGVKFVEMRLKAHAYPPIRQLFAKP